MDISYSGGGERMSRKMCPKVHRIDQSTLLFLSSLRNTPTSLILDLSHSDTRLSVMLNGLEVHVYNRSELYAKLERTFGLKPSILVPVS